VLTFAKAALKVLVDHFGLPSPILGLLLEGGVSVVAVMRTSSDEVAGAIAWMDGISAT
jgi:hypothetical protein